MFRRAWDCYSDESVNLLCATQNGEEKIQHNAITPILSINDDGEYQFNLILRNNRTDDEHPYGIFHPRAELHNIKQESIGIIEVMGLFILPGRLAGEMTQSATSSRAKRRLTSRRCPTNNIPFTSTSE